MTVACFDFTSLHPWVQLPKWKPGLDPFSSGSKVLVISFQRVDVTR